MSIIVPPPGDNQLPNRERRLTCPICGLEDPSPAVRVEHLGIMRADCMCPAEHLFVVRWNEVA